MQANGCIRNSSFELTAGSLEILCLRQQEIPVRRCASISVVVCVAVLQKMNFFAVRLCNNQIQVCANQRAALINLELGHKTDCIRWSLGGGLGLRSLHHMINTSSTRAVPIDLKHQNAAFSSAVTVRLCRVPVGDCRDQRAAALD